MKEGKVSWRRHLAVLALFAGITLVVTYPLPLRMGDVVAGNENDVYINLWADWWTKRALTTPGASFYWTDYIFYPDGVSLIFHSFSHTNTAISLALEPWLGQLAAYNVAIVLSYLLSAFGMYLLMAYLTGSTAAGVIAGTVFAFNPYQVFQGVRPVIVSTQWMPFTLLYLTRWLRERRRWQLGLAALFFLLNALTSWHLMILLSLWLVPYGAYFLATVRRHSFWERMRGLATFVLLGGLLVLPFIWPLMREQLMTSRSYVTFRVDKPLGMDVMHLGLPPWLEPGWRDAGYLGVLTGLLAVIGVWKRGRKAWLWFGSALVFLLIAIGPIPYFDGLPINGITFPWSRVFIPLLRNPFRFQVLVLLGLAGAAGYGWTAVEGRLGRLKWRALRPIALVAVLMLIVLDYSQWPFPTKKLVVSPFYEQLAQEPGEFAIAPFPANRAHSRFHMYYQITHGKKMVGGVVSRTPAEATRFLEEDDFIRALSSFDPDVSGLTEVSRGFDHMERTGIRYVVLHRDLMASEAPDRVTAFLSLHPAYEDEYLVAYRTDLQMGRDYTLAHELTPGLGLLRATVSPADSVHQGTFVGLDLYWGAVVPPEQDLVLQVELVAPGGKVAQVTRLPIRAGERTSQWTPDTLVVESYRMRVKAGVAPGQYEMRVGVADDETGEQVGSMAKVASLEILPVARSYDLPTPHVDAGACFGERLCVLGYDAAHDDDQLVLVEYWQANRLMGKDYVISTRLVDPSSGAFVCQKDAAPRDWTYPTTWWDVNEVVSDTVVCDTGLLPPGRYGLEVVVYDSTSGETLPVSGAGEHEQAVGQVLPLGEIELP